MASSVGSFKIKAKREDIRKHPQLEQYFTKAYVHKNGVVSSSSLVAEFKSSEYSLARKVFKEAQSFQIEVQKNWVD